MESCWEYFVYVYMNDVIHIDSKAKLNIYAVDSILLLSASNIVLVQRVVNEVIHVNEET